MKKNIEALNIEKALLDFLINSLNSEDASIDGKRELSEALSNLNENRIEELILEKNGSYKSTSIIKEGGLEIYVNLRRVIRDNLEIALTPKEFDILYFLVKNKGYVFTKEQIYQAVWEDNYLLDDSNIMAFIRKLRKKIEPNPDDPIYIITVWGIGYKFNDRL